MENERAALFQGAPVLHLSAAAEMIRTSSDRDQALRALQFLRSKAIEDANVEAKTKLCTLYSEGWADLVKKDKREADMWSRSIFDKHIANALRDCSAFFKSQMAFNMLDIVLECSDDHPEVQYLAGLLLTRAVGMERDMKRGMALLVKAAESGKADAAYELGCLYGDRYSYSLQDTQQAMGWYEQAVVLGDHRGYVDLAYGYYGHYNAPGEPDESRAFAYAERGAMLANDRYCQYILGRLFLNGQGTRRDAAEGVRWLTASAQQDFALAVEELAAIYFRGTEDIEQNYSAAFQWCTKGASTISFCQTALGDMYRNGWGVKQDFQKAFQYYQTAATQPDSPNHYAQYMLGEMFLLGEGIPQDTAVAVEWLQIAAGQGYEPARQRLRDINAMKRNSSMESREAIQSPKKPPNRWLLGIFGKKNDTVTL